MNKTIWVLMYNKEVTFVHDGEDGTVTEKEIVRAYQQRGLAFAKMQQANTEAGERDKDGNYQYYSIQEVNYV